MKTPTRLLPFPRLLALLAATVLPLRAAEAPAAPGPAPALAPAPAWPQADSDLKPDAKAVFGALPNGVRYIVLPNAEPPGRLTLRLIVRAGSLMEADNQRGLAHFLEHLAFNGSEHFPPGELVTYFQRLGMSFGGDTNAHTSFDETVYDLDLPETSGKILTDSMQLLRDYADGLLLLQSEVERERGVILAEMRDRDNVGYRTWVETWNFLFPDSLIARRYPIGVADDIRAATREQFLDLYTKWYTADRLTVAAIGDVKPEDIVPLIRQYFGSMAGKPARAEPDFGRFGSPGFAAKYHREAEAPAVEITLASVAPFTRGKDSAARRAAELRRDAADFILSRRLERLIRQPDAPLSRGSAFNFTYLNAVEINGIDAVCQPGQWRAAVALLEQELRRALEFGFTAAEVDEARAHILNALEQVAQAAPTRKSRDLAAAIVNSLSDARVFTHPADDLALAKPVLEALTPQQCLEALRAGWGQSGRRLFVSGNMELPDADAALTAAYQASAAVAVTPPADDGAQSFAYASAGAPGAVAERREYPDLGIVQLRFANQVRANLKRTDFTANQVLVLAQFGGGKLMLPKDQPGLAFVAQAVFVEGGLGKHSAEELQRLMAGKTVAVSFAVTDDYFNLGGTTTPRDLPVELEYLKAYLTDPGYRPEALALARRAFPQFFAQLRQEPAGVEDSQVVRFLASGDFRFGYPAEAAANAVTLDAMRAWLAPALADSYLEISLVGDFDPAQAEAALAATFGTLPARAAQRANYTPALDVKFPAAAEGREQTFPVESVLPKAIATVYWPTADMSDIVRTRRLSVLAAVLTDRLRVQIREAHGEAYSPGAANSSSEIYPGYGFTFAQAETSPASAAELAARMRDIGAALAEQGVSADEFARAVEPLKRSLVEYRRRNAYWLGRVLAGSQANPRQLEWARTLPTAYDDMTPAQLSALAKEYLQPGRAVRVLVLPTPAAAPATPATAP